MIKEKRIRQIKEYILDQQSVSLDELVKVFQVSKNTIRRDVQELVDSGAFKKVYGGVVAKQTKKLESFQTRKVRHHEQKKAIGQKAAGYIEDGDIIFLDSGTTTLEMFDYLCGKHITVVTNNVEFIFRSLPYENLNIISIGGILERKTNSLGRPQNIDLLKTYNISKAFMASTGISLSNGVTNSSPLETELKQTVVKRSEDVFLLVDHDKIGKYGLMTYAELNDVDYIITDKNPPESYQSYSKENSIEIVVADSRNSV